MSNESDTDSAALPSQESEFAVKFRKGHRKSLMQATINESVKLRQARLKAFREAQRGRIDGRHQYMIELISDKLGVDPPSVTEFMLDGNQVRKKKLHNCEK